MSHIEVRGLRRRIRETRDGLGAAVEDAIDEKVAEMQATAVSLVPRRTGNLAQLLARDDAIQKTREGGLIRWRFGFLSREAKDRAWYWRFVEFGTRGYSAGARRPAGTDRHGRLRTRTVARDVPPRKAQPFLRPALILFKQAVGRLGVKAFLQGARGAGRR